MSRLWIALLLLAAPAPGLAEAIEIPDASEIEDAIPEGGSLTGRELYDRFLKNKMHSAVQHLTVISTDPGGNDQETRFWVRWKDFRDENDEAGEDGVVARTLVKFQYPQDMRHTGFLMIVHDDKSSDQFVYRPSSRRVRRVNLSGASVMGSDYTFDDIAFQEIENASYRRLPDEEIGGVPVYVVEAVLKATVDSQYSRTLSYLEQEHYVPLRARYWDDAGVEVKELKAVYESVQEFDGVWVATISTMYNLKQRTSSTMYIEKLDPNPEIADQLFSTFRLQLSR